MGRYERAVTRRELLRLGVAASVAAIWSPRGLLHGRVEPPLRTTPPGPCPSDIGVRAPHLHVDVKGHTDRRVTQMFFPNEPLNADDPFFTRVPRNPELLVATAGPAPEGEDPTSRLIEWNIVLPRG